MVFNNTGFDVLEVGEAMMEGELAFKAGRIEEGLDHLRRSVEIDDGLLYDEPWGWMQPARHALGALLMEAGRFDEAEAVYRADLGLDDTLARACQHPGNVWSLHGLHECLTRRGERRRRGTSSCNSTGRGTRDGSDPRLLLLPQQGRRLVALPRAAIRRKRGVAALGQTLYRIGEVNLVDVVVAPFDADTVRLDHHIGFATAFGREEPVARQLDPETQRIAEIDRVHEAPVHRTGMRNAPCVETFGDLPETRLADIERQMMQRTDGFGNGRRVGLALLVGEDRDQPPVAGGVPPLKWSTNWGRFAPSIGGPGDGWEAREAGRHRDEAAAG
jgi:hypothetical protein